MIYLSAEHAGTKLSFSSRGQRCFLCLLALAPLNSLADELAVWNGTNGSWSDPSSWSTLAVPNNAASSSYSVVIGSGSVMVNSGLGTYQNPTPITVDSVNLAGTLTSDGSFPPQTLSVTGNLSSSGSILMDLYWPTLSVGGTLTNSGMINHVVHLSVGSDLINSGSIMFDNVSPPNSSLTVSGTLVNTGGIVLGSLNPGISIAVGRLTNIGSLYATSGSVINLTAQPEGITQVDGFMEFDQGATVTANGQNGFANLATVNGKLGFDYQNQPTQITPLGSTRTLTINGTLGLVDGPILRVNGNIANNGNIFLGGDQRSSQFPSTSLSATGGIVNNGQLSLGGMYSIGDRIQASELANNGTIDVADFATGSAISIANAGRINLRGNSSSLASGTGTPQNQFSGFEQFDDGVLNEVLNGTSSFGQIHTSGAADLSGELNINWVQATSQRPEALSKSSPSPPANWKARFRRSSTTTVIRSPSTTTTRTETSSSPLSEQSQQQNPPRFRPCSLHWES